MTEIIVNEGNINETFEAINAGSYRNLSIRLADGDMVLKKPLVFKGRVGEALYVTGSQKTNLIVPSGLKFGLRAQGGTIHLRDLKISGGESGPLVVLDSINADPGSINEPAHYNSSLTNVFLFSKSTCLEIGHPSPTSSQVSELLFSNVTFREDGGGKKGFGVNILCGGNTKCFTFRDCKFNGFNVAVNWPFASGFMELSSVSIGNSRTCIFQGGAGSLLINSMNVEQCGRFLHQTGGSGPVIAVVNGVEFLDQSENLPSILHGPCVFNGCTFGSIGAFYPRIFMSNPLARSYTFNGLFFLARGATNEDVFFDTNGNSLRGPVYRGRRTGVKCSYQLFDSARGRGILGGD